MGKASGVNPGARDPKTMCCYVQFHAGNPCDDASAKQYLPLPFPWTT